MPKFQVGDLVKDPNYDSDYIFITKVTHEDYYFYYLSNPDDEDYSGILYVDRMGELVQRC